MTVKELIEELKKLPPFMIVITHKGFSDLGHHFADGTSFVGGSVILITSHQMKDN